jgi:uncharacterized protein (TIGR03435 family)
MGSHARPTLNGRSNPLLRIASVVVLAATLLAGVRAKLSAQSTGVEAPNGQPPTPQWQIDAGGKMAFDVASIKRNKSSDARRTNFPLGPGDDYSPNGGLFTATNMPVSAYIFFAYKVTINQLNLLLPQLPKWVTSDGYDIQARASGNPTKDQMRLMMQSLLADRLKLIIHFETRQMPVFGLVLAKPGKTGPQLQQHQDNPSCSQPPSAADSAPMPATTVSDRFPTTCGGVVGMPPSSPGHIRAGGRNVSVEQIASTFSGPVTGVDRPVLDQTGLRGMFDFSMEFEPELNGPPRPGPAAQPDDSAGPTFLEALREQLGLRLESQTGPFDEIVVEHVEQPSEN